MARKKKDTASINVNTNINVPTQRVLSRGQLMIDELFNGEQTFGTGRNLPKFDGVLRSGNGLIKNGDYGDTRRLFI